MFMWFWTILSLGAPEKTVENSAEAVYGILLTSVKQCEV